MEIKELNKILESFMLNEMAQINNTIEVNNEDVVDKNGDVQEKFAHFHWLYKKKIHFKFANRLPKNITELRKLVAEKDSTKKISDVELKKALKDLNANIDHTLFGKCSVWEAAIGTWKQLHPKRDLQKELIIL